MLVHINAKNVSVGDFFKRTNLLQYCLVHKTDNMVYMKELLNLTNNVLPMSRILKVVHITQKKRKTVADA